MKLLNLSVWTALLAMLLPCNVNASDCTSARLLEAEPQAPSLTVTHATPSQGVPTLVSAIDVTPAQTLTRTVTRAKTKSVTSIADLAGTYVMSFSSLTSSVGDGGKSVDVAPVDGEPNAITITNFWDVGVVVKATVDVATKKFTIANQVVGTSTNYGDFDIAVINNDGTPNREALIEGVINEDGTLEITSWWAMFITSGDYKDKFFGAFYNTTFEKANGTVSVYRFGLDEPQTFGIVATQTSKNVVTIKNLMNYGTQVEVVLNRDRTAQIEGQVMRKDPANSDWYSRSITYTVGDDGKASLTGYSATINIPAPTVANQLSWTDWSLFSGNGSYYFGIITKTELTTTFDIEYPVLSVSDFEGEGTEESPYLIKTVDDLILLGDKVNGATDFPYSNASGTIKYARQYIGTYFRMENNIDMTGYRFAPIGGRNIHFAGVFDGNGKTITGLEVNTASDGYAGFFGKLDTVAVVKNLTLDKPLIETTGYYAGAIAAYSLGSIENCHVTYGNISNESLCAGGIVGTSAIVKDCSVTGSTIICQSGYCGGVAGEVSNGTIDNCQSIANSIHAGGQSDQCPTGGVVGNGYMSAVSNCYSTSLVKTTYTANQNAGGVVGTLYMGTIDNCFNTGEIYGMDTKCSIGGVVGYLMGVMNNCYNTGRVHCVSSRTVGGITGCVGFYNSNGAPVQSEIHNCYTAGVVTAETYMYDKEAEVRETLGSLKEGATPIIENVYYDAQMSDHTSVQYRSNTAALTAATGPAGFTADAWTFAEGYYPRLKGMDETAAAHLSAVALHMGQYGSASKVLDDVDIKGFTDTSYGLYKEGKLYNQGYYSSVKDNKLMLGTEFGTDTLFIVSNAGNRYYELKISPIPFEGAGTVDAPFLLKDKEDLIALSNITNNAKQLFPETYFKITNDIDLEYDTRFNGISSDPDDAHNQFAGHIDGGGFTIHRMKFDAVAWSLTPEDDPDHLGNPNTSESKAYKGIIGRLGTEGSLKNLNIAADCDLKFWATSGALVGYNYGLVENCRNYANISAVSCWVGGIVGQNLANATVRNCYNEGDVITSYMDAGGIAGSNNGTIENCMNVGDITARRFANFPSKINQTLVGGISGGSNGGLYRNVVNAGNITGVGKVGGIVGSFDKSTTGDGKNSMYNAVNYGTVSCETTSAQGAISGVAGTESPVEDVYFDCQVVPMPAHGNEDHEGMKPVETSVLTSDTALDKFDTAIWNFTAGEYPVLVQFATEPKVVAARKAIISIPTGVDAGNLTADATLAAGYNWSLAQGTVFTIDGSTLKVPASVEDVVNDTLYAASADALYTKVIMISQKPAVPLAGKGTQDEPYLISTPEEWNAVSDFISKCSHSFEGEYVMINADLDFTGMAFKMLANDGTTRFQGNLNGDSNTIKGINLSTTSSYVGALGVVGELAEVYDLTFEGSIKGSATYTAGVAAKVYGKMNNVVNKINVTSTKAQVAGIAALLGSGARLENCKNMGTISGASYSVAGIAVTCEEGVALVECGNEGKVESTATSTSVPSSYAYVSGIVAVSSPSIYRNCYNSGELVVDDTKVSGVAGIVGYANSTSTQGEYYFGYCNNSADLSANGLVAGIVALTNSSGYAKMTFEGCYNTGDIISAQSTKAVSGGYTAGIAAQYSVQSNFIGCYNTGRIISFKNVYAAGIAAYYKGSAAADKHASFEDCYNEGEITADGNQGAGVVAYAANYTTIYNCYNTAEIKGGFGLGGVVACLGANAVLENSWNAGNITSNLSRSGGVVGYNNSAATIKNCFNVGDVKTTLTTPGISSSTSAPSGYAIGGIAGTSASAIVNCYNMGSVTGASQVGGIVGQTSKGKASFSYCYNAGAVVAEADTCGAIIGVNPDVNGKYWNADNKIENCYYLADAVTSSHAPLAEALTVAQLAAIELAGEDWVNGDKYSYPMLADMTVDAAAANAAAVVLDGGNTPDHVTYDFHLGTPEGVVWSTNCPDLAISGNDAKFAEPYTGTLEVTATAGEYSVTHTLVCDKASGVDGIQAGKVVVKEVYYNVQGMEVPAPAKGANAVFMVVRTYDDGTSTTEKMVK